MSVVRTWLLRAASVLPLMLGIAAADWALKAGAVATGLHVAHHERDVSWALLAVVVIVNFGWFTLYATTPLRRVGIGLWFGGVLGNVGELAAHGHVTNFIPLPARYVASPADLCVVVGFALFNLGLWKGVAEARRRKLALATE
jgi:lipoprotein signal peptidase